MWYDCQLWNTSFQTSKHFFSKTVGSAADLMVQFYRAKIALTDESEEKMVMISFGRLLCLPSILCLFCHAIFVILEYYRINKLDK